LTIHHCTIPNTAGRRLQPDTSTAITTILVDTEATAHRYGWDQQPVLFGLFDHSTAQGNAAIEVDPTIIGPDLWAEPDPHRPGMNVPPPVLLHRLARDLTSPAASRWLDHWLHERGRTCVGIGLVFEAWAAPHRPGYRYGDLANAPVGQKREIRVVAAVDTDLGLHRITRVRDVDTPRVDRWAQLPAGSRHRRVVTGLDRLVRLARNH